MGRSGTRDPRQPAKNLHPRALRPLATDRKSLAPATGEQERLPLPAELAHAEFDDPKVETAYLNYARRAVKQFKPDFLNLGIEAGGILMRDPVRWRRFERLYEHVRSAAFETGKPPIWRLASPSASAISARASVER